MMFTLLRAAGLGLVAGLAAWRITGPPTIGLDATPFPVGEEAPCLSEAQVRYDAFRLGYVVTTLTPAQRENATRVYRRHKPSDSAPFDDILYAKRGDLALVQWFRHGCIAVRSTLTLPVLDKLLHGLDADEAAS